MNWLWLILALVVIGLLGDWLYSSIIHRRRRRWEQAQNWTQAGIRAGCEDFMVGSGRDGLAILMVHGYADSPGLFKKLAGRLATEQGWTCRAMRLPGSAEPLDQAAVKADLELWRRTIDAELTALAATHRQVWLLGHSMGGALVADAVIRRPDSPAGLIMLAPLVKVSAAKSPLGVPPRFWYTLLRRIMVFTRTIENWLSPNDAGTAYLDRFVHVDYLDQVFRLVDRLAGSVLPSQIPVLMVVAGRDRIVDSAAALAWLAAMPAGRKEAMTEPEMGHVLPVEDGWERVADTVASFIHRQAAGTRS
jgi:alpha-beta hydrolase superfamily lysophospholipase